MLWRREKSLVWLEIEIHFIHHPAYSLASILTELFQLRICSVQDSKRTDVEMLWNSVNSTDSYII